jgi:hypothetical protein
MFTDYAQKSPRTLFAIHQKQLRKKTHRYEEMAIKSLSITMKVTLLLQMGPTSLIYMQRKLLSKNIRAKKTIQSERLLQDVAKFPLLSTTKPFLILLERPCRSGGAPC